MMLCVECLVLDVWLDVVGGWTLLGRGTDFFWRENE